MSYFKSLRDGQFNREMLIGPMRGLKVTETFRLVGSTFSGGTVDTNFWTSTVAAAGATTQANGQISLTTGGTANGTARLDSVRTARYIGSNTNYFRSVTRFATTGTANNIRRIGAFDDNNGAFFELNGTAFNVVTRKTGSDTAVASGSFNGTAFTIDTNVHTFEIYWTNSSVFFYIDDVLRHTVSAATTTWSDTLNLKIRLQNLNSGGSTTNVTLEVRVATISRLGEAHTAPIFYNLANVNETRVLKYSPGTLHRIVANDSNAVGTITFYDNTAGSGTKIATIDVSGISGGSSLDYGLDFYTGLTYVSVSSPGDFTIIYE